ncbi:MAG: hypothetical protein CMJ19_12570 [Phycisphaeraceae bacterium]|nr:hypothetical protein [Phycisphaeraceae bacterium]
MTKWILLISALLLLPLSIITAVAQQPEPATLQKATKLFEDKHYAEAAVMYQQLIESHPQTAPEQLLVCYLRLRDFDKAVQTSQDSIQRLAGKPEEAMARQALGNLYMILPHWGTRSGGEFKRAKHEQGIRLQSHRHDKKLALEQLAKARELYAQWEGKTDIKDWHERRIRNLFDFASACAAFGIFEQQPHYWHWYWGQRDDTLADTAGEEDFDENQNVWQYHRKRPIGLLVDDKDQPIFPAMPDAWDTSLPDDEKALFLLAEIRKLDDTADKQHANLSLYRQAMLARKRFGMDRMNVYANMYHDGSTRPYREQLDAIVPWELADNQAIVLAGGKMRKVVLPEQWNILGLLDQVQGKQADEALFARGYYLQGRKQYPKAIQTYDQLIKDFPKSNRIAHAQNNKSRILEQSISVNVPGMQLPGNQAQLNVHYRNVDHVWFEARKFNLPGFLKAMRELSFDRKNDEHINVWQLGQWDSLLIHQQSLQSPINKLILEHLDDAVISWDRKLKPGVDHRDAQATVDSPIDTNGTYIVWAWYDQPKGKVQGHPYNHGHSRTVMMISDMAIVQKQTVKGNLYFITDSRNGAPLANSKLSILETWNEWNRKTRKTIYHKVDHDLVTDANGFALFTGQRNRGSQLHVMVENGDRFATNDLDYWNPYNERNTQRPPSVYTLTDRPVYRPGQTVKFKSWVRDFKDGQWENAPGRQLSITIYDPRGTKLKDMTLTTDSFGGISGQLELGDQATLGQYRIDFHGRYQESAGGNFRVEEYKKPEFEVTVKTSESQVKLGEKIKVDIGGRYYFGQPVTHGDVTYKVYRETYTHKQFLPGPWDWLYGQGYGLSWYESPWFGWWGRDCVIAPDWWYGWYPWWQPSNVRELVTQGEGKLDEQGKLTITIDSADALKQHGDQDHQYIVEAEVRDASRRVITGKGNVLATRQAYFTTLQPTRGYYRSGDQMEIKIICRNPDGSPVQTKGQLVISQVQWTGAQNTTINEVELDRQTIETDASGMATISYRYENSGQLKFHFTSPDSWGSTVESFSLVWVVGNQFDGKLHRFNELELITDKRTYEPGQTAHVMINTKQANSYVLLSTDAQNGVLKNWKLIHVDGKSTVIDVPVENKHRPNFFIEAVTVSDAKLHQQLAQICVPPADSMLDITVQTDKPTYQPGETATVNITAKDMTGKPAQTQVVLSAFDQALLYIAGRTSGNMGSYYHGQQNDHNLNSQTNLGKQFTHAGNITDPSVYRYATPEDWDGQWGPQVGDWRVTSGDEIRELGMLQKRGARASGGVASFADGAVNAPAPSAMPMTEAIGLDSSGMAKSELKVVGDDAMEEAQSQTDQPVSTRENFADTALWVDAITTDDNGKATATFTVPDNLTTWQIDSWAMSKTTQVGQGETQATATKNLLVRLQTPRFMVQRDQLILTANVHNYLDHETTVMVDLEIPHDVLAFVDRMATQRQVTIKAGGEATINWRVRAMNEGMARIAVTAKGKDASDAMAMTIPVIIHGSLQQQAQTAVIASGDDDKTIKVELNLPEQIDPKQTELYVSFSPTLIGTMLDALPYLLDYPYGCTEQTISRFVPAVQVRKTLQDMGLTLADIKKDFPAKQVDGKPYIHPWHDSPVFDDKQMNKLIDDGLNRILSMQNGDGGWGWWKGTDSRIYLTTHVLYALHAAQESGVDMDQNILRRAVNWLNRAVQQEIKEEKWSVNTQTAYAAYVLALHQQSGPWMEKLYDGRDKLNLYGKALLALSLHRLNKTDDAKTVLRNIMQYRRDNNETKLTWFDDPDNNFRGWWYWYNSDIETQAWILRAMTTITPNDEASPRVIKWLLNHRQHGYYWRSTRDTALCIDAMSRYVKTSGESDADYTLTLELDGGKVTKTVKINKDNLLTHDNTFVIKGVSLPAGKHSLTIRKQGTGALYLNSRLTYFGMQEHIPAYGHELHLKRTYYRLKQIPFEVDVDNSKGETITENRLRYERIKLNDGDEVASGEIIQVELNLEADNDYTYLAIEDFKPAGCEPIDVQSGYVRQEGFGTYRELRDQKTMFFIEHIAQGKHLLRYRLRAEVPGVFHALPARVFAMYVPRLDAGSDELIMKITD